MEVIHGPGWPLWEPTWPGRVVPVLDTVVTSLGLLRAREWRAARDAGLAKWAPAGVTFDITRGNADDYPKLDESRVTEPEYLDTLLVSGYMRLMRSQSYGPSAYAWWAQARDPASACFFDMQYFWQQTDGYQAYLVGHETGHCLGLSHQGPTAKSIMSGWMNPDQHDIDSVLGWNYQ